MTDHIGEATQKVIDLDALEKLADEATPGAWTTDSGDGPLDGNAKFQSNAQVLIYSDEDCDIHPVADASCNHSCRTEDEQAANAAFIAAANPATIKALIAELKALQAFAADEIAFAFCAGFKDAIDREKWDDCYDFAAAKAGDYRSDRIRAFLARNGKGEGQ